MPITKCFFAPAIIVLVCGLYACASPMTQPKLAVSEPPRLAEDSLVTSDLYRLPLLKQPESLAKPKGIIVALHGFNDYSRAFESMCRYMNLQNIACFAYDQRGFGATEYRGIWPGEGVFEADLLELVDSLERSHPDTPIYLIGESMGAAVIISALATTELAQKSSVAGAVLLAPAVWGRETQPWYQRWALALAVRLAPDWKPTGESLEIVATDNIEALRAMAQDELVIKKTRIDAVYGLTNLMDNALQLSPRITIPTLILYGEKDEVIPAQPMCLMLKQIDKAKLDYTIRLYAKGYHMLTRDLQAKTVFDDIAQWINTNTAKPITMSRDALCAG